MSDIDWPRWLSFIGLTMEFLSFWLVAPEILGEQRLKALEDFLEGMLNIIGPLFSIPVLIVEGIAYFLFFLEGKKQLFPFLYGQWIGGVLMFWAFGRAIRRSKTDLKRWHITVSQWLPVVVGVGVLLLTWELFKVELNLTSTVILIFVGLGTVIALGLSDLAAQQILRLLVDDSKVRQRALLVGVALFTLSFIIQAIAIFLPAST